MNVKSLSSQTKLVRAVVDLPIGNDIGKIQDEFDFRQWNYAMILHDKDFNANGEKEVPHWQIVIQSQKKHRLQFYLYALQDIFNTKNTDYISVICGECIELSIQYLVHKAKKDKDKYQYDIKDVIHNFDKKVFDIYMNADVEEEFNTETLRNVIKTSTSIDEVVDKIGIGRYNVYNKYIASLLARNLLGSAIKDD